MFNCTLVRLIGPDVAEVRGSFSSRAVSGTMMRELVVVDTKDLQTEREESRVLKEAGAGSGFSSTTTSEFEDKTV